MKYIITQEDAQKVLTYLAARPYQESFQLIAILQNLEPFSEPVPVEVKDD